MISTDKPGTPEELIHFGVKGMKWGVRRQSTRDFKAKYKTNRERTDAIRRARANIGKVQLDYEAERFGTKAKADLANTYLNHPDRATALRLTRGEKVVLALLAPAGPVGVGIGVGVGVRVAQRRRIEKRQRNQ